MPLRIIESNKGGKILVLTKKTNPPHVWYCKNKSNPSIKCQATCVTNGLDPNYKSSYYSQIFSKKNRNSFTC